MRRMPPVHWKPRMQSKPPMQSTHPSCRLQSRSSRLRLALLAIGKHWACCYTPPKSKLGRRKLERCPGTGEACDSARCVLGEEWIDTLI